MGYTTVFDATHHAFGYWAFLVFSVLLTASLVFINCDIPFLTRRRAVRSGHDEPRVDWRDACLTKVFAGIVLLTLLADSIGSFVQYRRAARAMRDGEAKMI